MKPLLTHNKMAMLAVGLACGAACAWQLAFGQGQVPTRVKEAEAEITKVVSDFRVREYAICHVRAALWGDYDAVVRVRGGATEDSRPRRFGVSKGRLVVTEEMEGPSQMATLESTGQVTLKSAEEAFARGVPFFVSEVGLVSPTEIAYTVTSNPQLKMSGVAARIEFIEPRIRSQVVNTPKSFSSDEKPLKRTFELSSPLDPKENTLLSIVEMTSGNPCLVSNEIDLTPFAKPQQAPK